MKNQAHPTFGNGKICYLEIPTDNIEGSANFYESIFGWQIRRDNDGHLSFDDSVGEVSGTWVTEREAATQVGLAISIMVYDIAATIELIIRNGGKIIQTYEKEAKEKVARFSDPFGNMFGLYQHGESSS